MTEGFFCSQNNQLPFLKADTNFAKVFKAFCSRLHSSEVTLSLSLVRVTKSMGLRERKDYESAGQAGQISQNVM